LKPGGGKRRCKRLQQVTLVIGKNGPPKKENENGHKPDQTDPWEIMSRKGKKKRAFEEHARK